LFFRAVQRLAIIVFMSSVNPAMRHRLRCEVMGGVDVHFSTARRGASFDPVV
jgi:hypothetical protein